MDDKKINTQLKKILEVMGQVIVLDARKNLKSKGKNASYSLLNSIKYKVVTNKGGLDAQLVISMMGYGLNVLGGRGANKKAPPPQKIVKWLIDKNLARKFLGVKGNVNPNNPDLEDKLSFIAMKIAKKIGKTGIKPCNFLHPAKVNFIGTKKKLILDKNYMKKIVDEYTKITKEEVTSSVMKQLQKMGTISTTNE